MPRSPSRVRGGPVVVRSSEAAVRIGLVDVRARVTLPRSVVVASGLLPHPVYRCARPAVVNAGLRGRFARNSAFASGFLRLWRFDGVSAALAGVLRPVNGLFYPANGIVSAKLATRRSKLVPYPSFLATTAAKSKLSLRGHSGFGCDFVLIPHNAHVHRARSGLIQ